MKINRIIRSNRERAGISSDRKLSERIGLKYPTFRVRMKDPGGWKLYELKSLIRTTHMPDEDILALVRGE